MKCSFYLIVTYYYTTPFNKYLARPDHHYLQIHDQRCAIFCLPYYTTMEQNILLRGIFIFKRDNELALRFYSPLIFCCCLTLHEILRGCMNNILFSAFFVSLDFKAAWGQLRDSYGLDFLDFFLSAMSLCRTSKDRNFFLLL